MGFPWLSVLTVLPMVGAIGLLCLPKSFSGRARRFAFVWGAAVLALTVWLWLHFQAACGTMQFEERHAWIASLHIDYHLGVDGLGILMLVLSAIVVLIGIAASAMVRERVQLYFALLLLLESCLFGAFTALNFVHWFTFWELSLIPAFFLIRLWGGKHRAAASTQFLVYTMVGSITMLLGFIAMYVGTGSFDFLELASLAAVGRLMPSVIGSLHASMVSPEHLSLLVFFAVFLGFAVKVPVVPFHTWLPSAYAEAPTGVTIVLTGALSKMGLYGFLRILLPLFSHEMQRVLTPLLWLACASVILSAFAALAQKDLKRVFAYSSINHLGYCVLGVLAAAKLSGTEGIVLTAQSAALSGVILQMFNHGLTAATIFWFIALLEARNENRSGLEDFGGIRKVAPVFAGLMGIALFSSLGLPGLNGFVGEFLIFKGAFSLVPVATAFSLIGLLVTVIFILGVIQRVFSGPLRPSLAGFQDLTIKEQFLLATPIALMFVLGLYPQLILSVISSTVTQIVQQIRL